MHVAPSVCFLFIDITEVEVGWGRTFGKAALDMKDAGIDVADEGGLFGAAGSQGCIAGAR